MQIKHLFGVVLIGLLVSIVSFISAFAAPRQPLYGTVVVIDPGHGGRDPGAHGVFIDPQTRERVTVDEAPYVFDVAKRLRDQVRALGGIALMTRYNAKQPAPINLQPNRVLPFLHESDVYTIGKTQARALTAGMIPRLALVKDASRRYPKHRIFFVSIHFDAERNKALEGTNVIAPRELPEIANSIISAFRAEGRARTLNGAEYYPVIQNGSVRNLYILDGRNNPLSQRILIELGNFSNPDDVWRLRNPTVRTDYARIIARGLANLNTELAR